MQVSFVSLTGYKDQSSGEREGKKTWRSISGIEPTLLKIIKEQSRRQAQEKLPKLSTGNISNFTSLMPEDEV